MSTPSKRYSYSWKGPFGLSTKVFKRFMLFGRIGDREYYQQYSRRTGYYYLGVRSVTRMFSPQIIAKFKPQSDENT